MNDPLVSEFLEAFDDSHYPDGFLADFELMECLAHNEQAETFLVKERKSGSLCVAKCYSTSDLTARSSESELLKSIHHDRLPAFLGEYQNDGMLCVLREYVEGDSLDVYARKHPISPGEALAICVQLCDELVYLHGLNPPVIHRDIKPQNVVMDGNGNARLIDFGNSRLYDKSAETDTVYFGTRHFAAPEQYGFSQTDARTDIFALGVLLGWLLTGETDVKIALSKITNNQVKHIVKKCTSFAPDNRYSSALKVKNALLQVINQRQNKVLAWAARLAIGGALIMLGFAIGRYTDLSFSLFNPFGVHFKEPLIEQAVRLELGKTGGETITREDLLNVSEIYIYGNFVLADFEGFQATTDLMVSKNESLKNGGIVSLKDLQQLANLRKVYIAYQNIRDVSPLSKLSSLEVIDLRHNLIEDFSSFSNAPSLKEMCVFETHLTDLAALAGYPMLESLNIGKTNVTSLEVPNGMDHLLSLHAVGTYLETLKGIENYDALQELSLSDVLDGDLSPLLSMPQLENVYLSENLRSAAERTLKVASFNIIYQ